MKKKLCGLSIFFLIIFLPSVLSLSFSPKEEIPNRPFELSTIVESHIVRNNSTSALEVDFVSRTWTIHKPSDTWYKDFIQLGWFVGGSLGWLNNTDYVNFICSHYEANETTVKINENYTSAITERQGETIKILRSQNSLICKQTVFLTTPVSINNEIAKDVYRYFPLSFTLTNYKGNGCAEIEDEILLTDASFIDRGIQDYTTFLDYIVKLVEMNFEFLTILYWMFKIGLVIFGVMIPLYAFYYVYERFKELVMINKRKGK